jgi:hypothetical protein
MSDITRLQNVYKRADDARAQEISIYNPLPPFEEMTHPWTVYWNAYRKGDFWTHMRGMPSWKSRPQTNIPFQVVQTNTTLLTDSRPTAVPYSESGHTDDFYLAEWLKASWLHWWNQQYGDLKTTLGVLNSRIFGIGWWRLDADKDGQKWHSVHPDQIRVSPDTTLDSMLVKEPTVLIYEYDAQVGELKSKYPSTRKRKVEWDKFDPNWKITADYERIRPMDREERLHPNNVVRVFEFWEQDPSEVEWKEPIGDDMEVTLAKKKHPGGRVTIIAGGIQLDSKSNPYKHKQFPFTPVFAYLAPGQFYPIGDIQNVWPLVITRNRMDQMVIDQTFKSGGGKTFLGKASQLKATDLTNAPFEVIECGDVNQIRQDTPLAPSRHIFEYIAKIDRDIDNMAGIHDISRGARSPGNPVTAQEAMMLGESDRTRIRLASRLLTWSLNRMCNQWCYNAAQYDTEEQVYKVVADPNEATPGFEDAAIVPKTFKPQDILVDGKIEEGLKYGIRFAEFSSLPASLNEDKQLAVQLYQAKILDEEDLLLALDWPNARAVAQKAKARMQPPPQPEVPQQAPEQMPPEGMPPEGMPQQAMMQGSPDAMPQAQMPEGIPPEIQAAVEQLISEGMGPEEAVQAVLSAAGVQ